MLVSAWDLETLVNVLGWRTERKQNLKRTLVDPFSSLSNCLPAFPAATNAQNRHQ